MHNLKIDTDKNSSRWVCTFISWEIKCSCKCHVRVPHIHRTYDCFIIAVGHTYRIAYVSIPVTQLSAALRIEYCFICCENSRCVYMPKLSIPLPSFVLSHFTLVSFFSHYWIHWNKHDIVRICKIYAVHKVCESNRYTSGKFFFIQIRIHMTWGMFSH